MFDVDKMFEDVAKMIETTANQRLPVNEAMQAWFQYCRDVAPDHHALWDQLAALDLDTDFRGLTQWVSDLLQAEPPPPDINGLWFGLHNPCLDDGEPTCQLYLAGSKRFDKSNPYADWHCGPEYWPDGRCANSDVLTTMYRQLEELETDENYLGEACLCHGYVAAVVANWCGDDLGNQLVGPDKRRAVAMGHDSGDIHFIHLPE